MVGIDNAGEEAHGHGALRSGVRMNGSLLSHDSESYGGGESVENSSTAPLFEKVDGWVHSVEQSEKRARDLALETAELKNHLERLLNEIVTTRKQMCPRAPRFTHPSMLDVLSRSPTHSVLALGCNAKLQKVESRCCI